MDELNENMWWVSIVTILNANVLYKYRFNNMMLMAIVSRAISYDAEGILSAEYIMDVDTVCNGYTRPCEYYINVTMGALCLTAW